MPRFKLDIVDFCADMYGELEKISIGKHPYECEFEAMNLDVAGVVLSGKLIDFIKGKLEVVDD